MLNAVFDHGLQQQLRDPAVQQLLGNVEFVVKAVVVSGLLQQEIVVDILHIGFQWHLGIPIVDAVAHQGGEGPKHPGSFLGVLLHLKTDGFHDVENKVRIELRLQVLDLHPSAQVDELVIVSDQLPKMGIELLGLLGALLRQLQGTLRLLQLLYGSLQFAELQGILLGEGLGHSPDNKPQHRQEPGKHRQAVAKHLQVDIQAGKRIQAQPLRLHRHPADIVAASLYVRYPDFGRIQGEFSTGQLVLGVLRQLQGGINHVVIAIRQQKLHAGEVLPKALLPQIEHQVSSLLQTEAKRIGTVLVAVHRSREDTAQHLSLLCPGQDPAQKRGLLHDLLVAEAKIGADDFSLRAQQQEVGPQRLAVGKVVEKTIGIGPAFLSAASRGQKLRLLCQHLHPAGIAFQLGGQKRLCLPASLAASPDDHGVGIQQKASQIQRHDHRHDQCGIAQKGPLQPVLEFHTRHGFSSGFIFF